MKEKEEKEQEEWEEKTVREGPAVEVVVEVVGSGTIQLPPGATVDCRTTQKAPLA